MSDRTIELTATVDKTVALTGTVDKSVALVAIIEGFDQGIVIPIQDGMPIGLLLALTHAGI